tara:strand:+ start:16448 stop:17431 length:984 start_codon:yes stop_codon:yes gene_type:complete
MFMKNICIISSPLQFTNFAEYVYQNKLESYFLIVLYYSNLEIDQINELNSIYNLNIYKRIRGFKFLQYIWLFLFGIRVKNCERFIIGNYFSDPHLYICNLVKNNQTIIVDDGIISHSIPDYLLTEKRIIKESSLKQLVFKLFRINTSYPKNFSLFTIFDIKDQENLKIQKNTLSFIKSKLKSKKNISSTILIGQPFVELKMMDEDQYVHVINKLISRFSDTEILYYPSRKENKSKLSLIKGLDSIEIVDPKTNIETFLIKSNYLPENIVGFTSTALITINKILNSKNKLTNIYSFKLNLNQSRLSKDLIDKMYHRIFSYGVVNLNLS